MRRDGEKVRDYELRHDVPKWYDHDDALLNDPEINAVSIATPPSSHKEYAVAVLNKGLHVYLEKPSALNAAETDTIADAVRNSYAKIAVAHYRRKVPMFHANKQLPDENAIGNIRIVTAQLHQSMKPELIAAIEKNWRIDPALSGGGLLHDLSPHLLDLMIHWFGAPLRFHGYALNQSRINRADEMVSGQIVFPRDVLFTGDWNFSSPEREVTDECRIIGAGRCITFALFGNEVTVRNERGETKNRSDHPPHIQQPMIGSVVQYFPGLEENPCTEDEARNVIVLIDSFAPY